MSGLEWAAQAAVIALLAGMLPVAWRLERALRGLRGDREALSDGAASLGEATRQAEAALLRLRATAELAGRQVTEKVAAAEPVRDELRYLLERAEAIAARLERAVEEGRPLAAGRALPDALPPSEAERGLIRALGLRP
ncbi:MAG: hypothetical protein K2X11_13905 [Acetobacteraceae bacterium]|nr:hypothetical protein [Acetobacteraceae bacterium]